MTRGQFRITKVKRNNEGKIADIQYDGTVTMAGNKTANINAGVNLDRIPHPDLLKAIDAFSSPARSLFSTDDKQSNMGRFQAHTIQKHGDDDKCWLMVSAHVVCRGGLATSVNTPRVFINRNITGIEEQLTGLWNKLEDECWLYLFEGKFMDTELPFDDELESKAKKGKVKKMEVIKDDIEQSAAQ